MASLLGKSELQSASSSGAFKYCMTSAWSWLGRPLKIPVPRVMGLYVPSRVLGGPVFAFTAELLSSDGACQDISQCANTTIAHSRITSKLHLNQLFNNITPQSNQPLRRATSICVLRSTIKMKFQPTSEELSSAIFHAMNAPSDLNTDDLNVSGSNWSTTHLTALRVVVLNNVNYSRLYPSEYWPSESNEGCHSLRLLFGLSSHIMSSIRSAYRGTHCSHGR